MTYKDVFTLTPFHKGLNTCDAVLDGLNVLFKQCYGVDDILSLTALEFLKYRRSKLEHDFLRSTLKQINMFATCDPHYVIQCLEATQCNLKTSDAVTTFLPDLSDWIDSLVAECQKLLRDAHSHCRKINQKTQQ